MKKFTHIALVAAFFVQCACSSQKERKPTSPPISWLESLERIFPKKKPRPPAATPVDWAGTIRMVNRIENFVLIETQSATPCIIGEKYFAIRDGGESAILRITSLKAHPFVIADIVEGDPKDGDKIYLPRPAWGGQRQGAPSSTDTVSPRATE